MSSLGCLFGRGSGEVLYVLFVYVFGGGVLGSGVGIRGDSGAGEKRTEGITVFTCSILVSLVLCTCPRISL
jgi:hypothetical protein